MGFDTNQNNISYFSFLASGDSYNTLAHIFNWDCPQFITSLTEHVQSFGMSSHQCI